MRGAVFEGRLGVALLTRLGSSEKDGLRVEGF